MQSVQFPSKRFLRNAAIITVIVGGLVFVQTKWFRNVIRNEKKDAVSAIGELTVREAIAKDSNQNGISDWEERLWGLDPTVAITDGVSNKTIIEQRRGQFAGSAEATPPTQTDKISRDLFALSTALEQNNTDTEAVERIAEELGTEISASGFPNRFRLGDIKTVKTTQKSLQTYHQALSNIYKKYPTLGSELTEIATASDTGVVEDPGSLEATATAYQVLAKEFAAISVPIGIADHHLGIINSLDHIGSSIRLLIQLEEDGINALLGASFYGNYTVVLSTHSEAIQNYLSDYSIISE